MKKYKPWKLILIMLLLSVFGSLFTFLVYKSDDIVTFILLAICMLLINIFTLVVLFYFVKLYDDKIVFRQGFFLTKNNKNPFTVKESWLSTFYVYTIAFDEIEKVVFYQNNQIVLILKGGNRIQISFGGYSKTTQQEIFQKLQNRYIK